MEYRFLKQIKSLLSFLLQIFEQSMFQTRRLIGILFNGWLCKMPLLITLFCIYVLYTFSYKWNESSCLDGLKNISISVKIWFVWHLFHQAWDLSCIPGNPSVADPIRMLSQSLMPISTRQSLRSIFILTALLWPLYQPWFDVSCFTHVVNYSRRIIRATTGVTLRRLITKLTNFHTSSYWNELARYGRSIATIIHLPDIRRSLWTQGSLNDYPWDLLRITTSVYLDPLESTFATYLWTPAVPSLPRARRTCLSIPIDGNQNRWNHARCYWWCFIQFSWVFCCPRPWLPPKHWLYVPGARIN